MILLIGGFKQVIASKVFKSIASNSVQGKNPTVIKKQTNKTLTSAHIGFNEVQKVRFT